MSDQTSAEGEPTDPTDLKFVGEATAPLVEAAGFTAADIREKRVSYRMLVEAGVNPGVAAKIRRWHSLSWSFDTGDDLDRRSRQVRGLEDEEREWVAASSDGQILSRTEDAADSDADSDSDGDVEDDSAAESAWAEQSETAEAAGEGEADADEFAAEAEWVAAARGDDESSERDADAAGETEDSDLEAESAWVASATDGREADGSGDALEAESAWQARSVSPPVTELADVGEDDAERLREAGVTSLRSLATCSPDLVADLSGLDEDRVRAWRDDARERMK